MPQIKIGYVPYGAYSLKASYQLNLLLAMAITITIVSAAVLGGWIAIKMTPKGPRLPDNSNRPIIVDTDILPRPTIIRENKPKPGGEAKPSVDVPVGRPVPVPDEFIEDDAGVIASQDEISEMIDNLPGIGSIGNGEIELREEVEYRPHPDSFVYCEIEPEMIYEQAPQYPRFAAEAGITGTVWIKALVDEQGNVAEVMIAKSSENKLLDEAAERAAYKNKFSPAIQNGRPIAVWVTYRVVFELD